MSSMESGAPLLNDYKLAFFAKRFPQTLLGGLKLRLGYKAPFYVYINQLLFFLCPFVFGGIFTGLSESLIVNSLTCCYVFASLVTCSVITVNIVVWFKEKQYTNVSKIQQNVLAEEDEVDFESCCGLETLEFIFTAKKSLLQICLHGVVSGIMCGLLFLYLLPSNLNKLYSNTAATIVLYIFGWLTVCVAQYSLTASPPPEPASFRPQMSFDISPFMRSFYVVIFGTVGVIAQSHPELLLADQILHCLFPFLLFLWIFGTLPPLDALFPWLLEQYLIFAVGGSPMATDIRLLIMVLISSIPVILVVFIPSRVAVIIISCVCGYILSLELFSIVSLAKSKVESSETIMTTGKIKQWSLKEVIVIAAMFVLGVSCSAVGAIMSDKATSSMLQIFGVTFCVIVVILKLLGDFQGVYIFGLIRNPLFPRSTQSSTSFKQRKHQLKQIAKVYHVLLGYVCPLLMAAFLGLFLNNQSYEVTRFTAVLCAFGIVRAMRQIWQNTMLCILDLCVVCLIDKSWWITSDLAIQILFTSLCRDRTLQFLKKMAFLSTVAVTSVSLKKQHHKATPTVLILSVFFLPVLLAIVLSTVVLSSPLIPMFCLPVFLIGFPRPLRSWPLTGNTKISTGPDAVYYKQLAPEVIMSLTQSLASGALGIRQAGEHFILRYQDRLVWVHVVESGYRFIAVVIKGLEMQETSCHTLEAARVDEIFETAFIRDDMQSIFYFNPYFFNTLSPCDVATLQSYSDARNVLTGIIDQRDNLLKVSENFIKTFTWVLLHHCRKTNKNLGSVPEKIVQNTNEGTEKPPNAGRTVIRVNSRDDGDINKSKNEIKSTETSLLQRSGSLPSINGSIWSQDSYELETLDLRTGKHSSKQATAKKRSDFESLDCFLDEVIESKDIKPKTPEYSPLGGFPAVDVGARKNTGSGLTEVSTDTLITVLPYREPQNDTNRNTITDKPLMSKASYQLDLPLKWKTDLPLNDKQLKPLFDKFSSSWYQHIINELHLSEDDSVGSDSELMARHQRLILNVYTVVEMLGYPGSSSTAAGPIHPYKVCNGEIPWSIHLDWLQKDTTLMSLVLKSYRYAFKLMYDEAVLGEITSFEECEEYLSEYESDWYMGQDTDNEWTTAVLNTKPNLFSLGRNTDDGTYTSRVLTCQSIHAPIGLLNSEAVRGQWASLALELLYFTNDDEERYSIQAHPVLLRNLTIQAADPPLGYPVYSSGLLSVPIHVSLL